MKALTAAVAVAMMAAFTLSGCSRDNPTPGGTTPSTTTGTQATATTGTTPSTTQTPALWSSSPQVVTRNIPVPPVPRLMAIRPAQHPESGYDRITFDFASTLPGYDIRYVDKVIADGSGQPVTVPGRKFLQIIFRPAQAHDDSGTQAVTPRSMTLNYPQMTAYAITGDFEGVLTIVLGLDDVVGFRVGELPGTPGRIYVDVAA